MGYQNIYAPVQHLRKTEIKPGGFCYVFFAKWEDVQTWPQVDPLTGICNTAIILKNDATWFELQIAESQNFFTEALKVGTGGSYLESKVSGYLGGNAVSHALGMQAMNYSQFVLLVKDKNGIFWLIGDEDSGMDLNYNFTSGDPASSRKRPVEFSWESINGAMIYKATDVANYTEVIIPPFALEGDFNDDFDNDFNN